MNKQDLNPSALVSDREFIFNLDPSKFLVFGDYIRLEQEKLKQGILEQDRIREEGRKEGIEEGIKKGIEKGKEEARAEYEKKFQKLKAAYEAELKKYKQSQR